MPKIEKDLLKVKGSDGQWHYVPAVGGEGGSTPTWETVQNKPFTTLGDGLEVDENGVLSAEGGSGGSANAVQYVAQSLTDEQQAQARENIGADPKPYYAKISSYHGVYSFYDGNGYDELKNAIAEGRTTYLKDTEEGYSNSTIIPYLRNVGDQLFYGFADTTQGMLMEYMVKSDNTITVSYERVLNEKVVRDELAKKLDNPQTATIGDVLMVEEVDGNGKPTKWKSVDTNAILTIDNTGYKGTDYYALPDGVYNLLSLYVANKDGMNLRLQGVTSVKNHSFVCAEKNTNVIFGSDGSVAGYDYGVWRWSEKENVSNKVTSLSATSKDSQYPSAKAVYDALTTAIPKTLPNPHKLTFAGAVTGKYDGSSALTVDIPQGGDNTLGITTAAVGQIIKVKSVDGAGKPTEWEAADLPSGGEIELVSDVTTTEEVNMITYSPPVGYWATDYVIDVTTPVYANGSANATYYIRPDRAQGGMLCKNALRPTEQFAVSAYLISKNIGNNYIYMIGLSKGRDVYQLALPYGRFTQAIQVYTASDTVLFPVETNVKIYARLVTEAEKNANLQ